MAAEEPSVAAASPVSSKLCSWLSTLPFFEVTPLAAGSFMRSEGLTYAISEAAVRLFLANGFDNTVMVDIASEAKVSEADLYTHFGSKEDIVLFVYQRINTEWQLRVEDFGADRLVNRFRRAIDVKLQLIAPYKQFLGTILEGLANTEAIAVSSPKTTHIRSVVMKTIGTLISRATDRGSFEGKIDDLELTLFTMHWAALMLGLSIHDSVELRTSVQMLLQPLDAIDDSTSEALPASLKDVISWMKTIVPDEANDTQSIDRAVLKIILNHRKVSHADPGCERGSCETCLALHRVKISYFTSQNLPIHFVLPAFPAKSPNTNKVLGTLADFGEEIALVNLDGLCRQIQSVYPPGARITICSDGRIFSELVGVSDDNVSAYVDSVRELIAEQGLRTISVINLEDLLDGSSFDELREKVLTKYSEDISDLRHRLSTDDEFKNMFNGIHRFISDDRRFLFPNLSATKVKEESKPIALGVIRNSNAWTRFLVQAYPNAVRLSIHPYPAHSEKIGIQLTKATNNWITPWHGVIVLQEDGYVLMKRTEAEALGAMLVTRNERPYFYSTMPARTNGTAAHDLTAATPS